MLLQALCAIAPDDIASRAAGNTDCIILFTFSIGTPDSINHIPSR